MLYIVNLYIELLNFLIFKILPMLMECSILLMGNTVKWQGGDINKAAFAQYTHATSLRLWVLSWIPKLHHTTLFDVVLGVLSSSLKLIQLF